MLAPRKGAEKRWLLTGFWAAFVFVLETGTVLA
jgi:hypothetical protein